MAVNTKNPIRNANMLLFASQIVNIGFGLLAIFITLLADEINLRPLEIGVIISIFMVARAISAAIIPALSDKIGRKPILVIALLLYALSTVGIGFGRTFLSLFLLRIIEGAATGAVFPTAEALLVDSVPVSERGAWMGKYFMTFNFGFIIGPALGGVLFTIGRDFFHFSTLTAFLIPFMFTGCLGFISMLSVIFFVEDVFDNSQNERKNPNRIHKTHENATTPYFVSFLIVGVLSGFALGLIIPIFALHMDNAFSLDEGSIGFIFTISGTAGLLVNYPAGRLSDKVDRLNIVFIGMILAWAALICVGISTALYFVITFFVIRSMAFQAYLPAYRAFQADKIPPWLRGKIMGRIQSSFNVGAALGPLIGAGIYEIFVTESLQIFGYSFYGGGVPFVIAGLFGLVQIFIIFYVIKEEKTKLKGNKAIF